MQLVDKKTQLERERDKTSTNDPKAAEEHKQTINQLENEVRNFDTDWKAKQIELEKIAAKKRAQEEKAAAEKKALEDAQAQALEGDRTPNLPIPTTNTTLQPKLVAPIPIPKSTTTTPLPIPTEPIVQPSIAPVPIAPLRPVLSGSATINN